MDDTRWGRLPEQITPQVWKRVRSALAGGIKGVFGPSGVRDRTDSDGVWVRCDPYDYLYVAALFNDDGTMRDNAHELMSDVGAGAPPVDLSPGVRAYCEANGVELELLGRNERIQLSLLAGTDSVEVASELCGRGDLGAYRLGVRWPGWMRFAFWHMVERLADGMRPEDLTFRGFGEAMTTSGLIVGQPNLVVTPPMMTRNQPTAMVYMTNLGSHLVLVSRAGGGFRRDINLPTWPVGWSSPEIGGTGEGAYRGSQNHPADYGDKLLADMTLAGNRVLGHVTDPTVWANSDRVVDLDERTITWTSVRFGLDALNNVAANYGSSASMWEAYRALGTLQGIWEGPKKNSVPLGWLFDPSYIRSVALPEIPNDEHRRWASVVVNNFETALEHNFGGTHRDNDHEPCPAARDMANLRNLVHGVGDQGHRPRTSRLDLLRSVEAQQGNLMLVKDLAGIWWCAAMSNPRELLSAGKP